MIAFIFLTQVTCPCVNVDCALFTGVKERTWPVWQVLIIATGSHRKWAFVYGSRNRKLYLAWIGEEFWVYSHPQLSVKVSWVLSSPKWSGNELCLFPPAQSQLTNAHPQCDIKFTLDFSFSINQKIFYRLQAREEPWWAWHVPAESRQHRSDSQWTWGTRLSNLAVGLRESDHWCDSLRGI